jgi:hypothetical protein
MDYVSKPGIPALREKLCSATTDEGLSTDIIHLVDTIMDGYSISVQYGFINAIAKVRRGQEDHVVMFHAATGAADPLQELHLLDVMAHGGMIPHLGTCKEAEASLAKIMIDAKMSAEEAVSFAAMTVKMAGLNPLRTITSLVA